MSGTEVASYLMNPAEDVIVFGDELAEGMWVISESPSARYLGEDEDARLRAERFCRVTRLRRVPPVGTTPEQVVFIGEQVDGYQMVQSGHLACGWIVKRESLPGAAVTP